VYFLPLGAVSSIERSDILLAVVLNDPQEGVLNLRVEVGRNVKLRR
jgi:hypothetical protein